jgi:predicted nuclease of restriction endonuclease-like (RecB) superfamily
MLQLNEAQIKELETFLLEIPAKFANPIFQFLGKVAQENAPKEPTTED